MRRQLEGSRAVAEAIARCRPEVISAYPISPQTHIVEALSQLVKTGELAPCEYVNDAHLFSPVRRDDVIARIQARADRNVERFGL